MTYYEALKVLRDGDWFDQLPKEYQSSAYPQGQELLSALYRAYDALQYVMDYGDERR